MRFTAIGTLFAGTVLAAAAAAQTVPTPAATLRKVIVAAKLPTVTDVPLHFKALSVTLSPGEKSRVSGANGVLYQISGSTEVTGVGEANKRSTSSQAKELCCRYS
jgi:hypothetical protein